MCCLMRRNKEKKIPIQFLLSPPKARESNANWGKEIEREREKEKTILSKASNKKETHFWDHREFQWNMLRISMKHSDKTFMR